MTQIVVSVVLVLGMIGTVGYFAWRDRKRTLEEERKRKDDK